MSKHKKVKTPTEEPSYGPRVLALFHYEEHWRHVLAWVEWGRVKGEDEKGHPTFSKAIVAVHLLRTDDGRVLYEKRRGTDVRFLEPTKASTTAPAFTAYLCRKLLQNGGNLGAYESLGIERPALEAVATAETAVAHAELYTRAARLLKVSEEELRQKYAKLNPGLQAMNLRNRLRKAGHNV